MDNKYLKLNDISAYKIAFNLSNYVWNIVMKWEWFAKDKYNHIFTELKQLPKELNSLIKFTNEKLTI